MNSASARAKSPRRNATSPANSCAAADFRKTPLRPIPQIWHDPLSTLRSARGALKNLMYVSAATTPFADGGSDVFVVVSLMQSGDIEVRLLRGAPSLRPTAARPTQPGSNIFAVFSLTRKSGPCSF